MIVGRRKGEPRRAWQSLQIYMAMPFEERSLKGVLARLGPLERRPWIVARWIDKYDWNARTLLHVQQIEQTERIERILRLERQADELRVNLLDPYIRASDRYKDLISRGEPDGSPAVLVALLEMAASVHLAEEALLIMDNVEWTEAVIASREARASFVRSGITAEIAGPTPVSGVESN